MESIQRQCPHTLTDLDNIIAITLTLDLKDQTTHGPCEQCSQLIYKLRRQLPCAIFSLAPPKRGHTEAYSLWRTLFVSNNVINIRTCRIYRVRWIWWLMVIPNTWLRSLRSELQMLIWYIKDGFRTEFNLKFSSNSSCSIFPDVIAPNSIFL